MMLYKSMNRTIDPPHKAATPSESVLGVKRKQAEAVFSYHANSAGINFQEMRGFLESRLTTCNSALCWISNLLVPHKLQMNNHVGPGTFIIHSAYFASLIFVFIYIL